MTARKYDLDAMQSFIDLLDKGIAELADHSSGVKRAADGVLTQFSGAAANAYANSHIEWQNDTAELVAELRSVREKVAVARANYLAAEQANREMRA